MNRRQKRAVGAIAVFVVLALIFMFSGSAEEGEGDQGPAQPQNIPQAEPEEKKVEVVVAATDIKAQEQVSAEMLETIEVPESVRHENATTSIVSVVDQFAIVNIYKGEQILRRRLGESSSSDVGLAFAIEKGNRAVSVSADKVRAVAGYIQPGTLVDIVATLNIGGRRGTKVILQKKKIIAIDDAHIIGPDGKAPPPPKSDSKQGGKGGEPQPFGQLPNVSVVTFEVTPEEAEVLLLAQQNAELHLEIRHPDDPVLEQPAIVWEEDIRNPNAGGEEGDAEGVETTEVRAPPHSVEMIMGNQRTVVQVEEDRESGGERDE